MTKLVCACGKGYASAFDGRCVYCREAEVCKLRKRRQPWQHLLHPDDPRRQEPGGLRQKPPGA